MRKMIKGDQNLTFMTRPEGLVPQWCAACEPSVTSSNRGTALCLQIPGVNACHLGVKTQTSLVTLRNRKNFCFQLSKGNALHCFTVI